MFKKLFAFFLVCISIPVHATNNEFDVVCGIFKELLNKSDLDKLSAQQRGAFVTEKVHKALDSSSATRVSWEAIVAAEPSQRYELFKTGAEDVLGKSWSCKPMEALASSAGE